MSIHRRRSCAALVCGTLSISCGRQEPAVTADCEVGLTALATLRGEFVGRAGLALVTPERILVVNNSERATIHVFGRDGQYIRSIGGPGDGPGEYRSINDLRAPSDGGLAVFDSRSLRVTYYSRNLDLTATHGLPVSISPHGAVRDPRGGWFLAGHVLDRDRLGSAAVHVGLDGSPDTYFRTNEPGADGEMARTIMPRAITFHPVLCLFTLKYHEYSIEVWDLDGTLERSIELEVDWFSWPPPWHDDPPEEGPTGVIGERQPEDQFLDMQFSDRGELWTLSQVTPEAWRDGISGGRVTDYAAWTDNVIHVLDPADGSERCLVRLEDIYLFGGFAGPGILKSINADAVGEPTVTFWEPTPADTTGGR